MTAGRPLLLAGGRVVDPSQNLDEPRDLLVLDGRIESLEPGISCPDDAERVDVAGHVVAPGLVDLGAELREPGNEEDETVQSASDAALAGGFTSVLCCSSGFGVLAQDRR